MRPRRLQIQGLRSYRHYVDIPFDREGLIAIVGDTGAGKSSILEAITFALYAATSWDRRNIRALISNHAKKASVTFDFAAGGKEWRVTRATSTTGQPVHLLECISDPSDPLARVDGEAAVNDAVAKVVGLDYETFQSAVVLPQGQFQHLLRCTPGQKASILKSILRLEDLEVVRNLAEALLARVRPLLKEKADERQRYSASPADDLRNAGLRKSAADGRLKTLRELRGRVGGFTATIATENKRAEHLRTVGQGLCDCEVGHGGTLAQLLDLDSELAAEAAARQSEVDAALESEHAAEQILTFAEEDGVGLATLLAAVQALDGLSGELDALGIRQNAIVGSRAEHERLTAEAAGDIDRLAEFEGALSAAQELKGQRESMKTSAESSLRNAQSALNVYRERGAAAREALATVATATTTLEEANSALGSAEEAAASLNGEVSTAESRLEEVRRSNAAAHAARGLKAGDLCPVCARAVPPGFNAPEVIGDEAEVAAVTSARAEALTAERLAEAARQSAQQAERVLTAAHRTHEGAAQALTTATASLQVLLGPVDLGQGDDVLLDPLSVAVASATPLCAEAEAEVIRSAADLAAHQAAALGRANAIASAARAVADAESALEEAMRRIQGHLDAIPARYRPVTPVAQEACASARAEVDAEQKRLHGFEDGRRAAVARRKQAEKLRQAIVDRRRIEVDVPVAATAQPLAALSLRVGQAADALETKDVPPLASDADLSVRAQWAADLDTAAKDFSQRLETAESEALQRASRCADEQLEILAAAGFNSLDTLDEAVTSVMVEHLTAERDEIEAKRQLPIAAALDAQIVPATTLVEDLEELTALLSDAKFVKYATTRKQQALLGVASDVLGSMTGSRYGFSGDFQIIDRMADLPRDPKTLSGGETFLASLALALGLVEIAGRSGGRLDAFFLDEGFGSLDADSLDEALSELERVVSGGRMVAVVSHLKAVAERIDNVLYVRRRPGDRSSEAEWIDGGHRDALVMKEVEESLLS
jgi:DNA repair protein SbcC/Rad50